MSNRIITLDKNPGLKPQIDLVNDQAWPEFMMHGNIRYWNSLFDELAAYQILFTDQNDKVIAVGHTVPFDWDGTLEDLPPDIDSIIVRGREDLQNGIKPTVLSAIVIMIKSDCRNQGLSGKVIEAMIALARQHGLKNLLAPLRPTVKAEYPLIPFEEYISWHRPDGQAFDPWIRVHLRMGAKILKIMPESFTVTGSVKEWEDWTGIKMPGSGKHIVPGALVPVDVDYDKNLGVYVEPNLWLSHAVPGHSEQST